MENAQTKVENRELHVVSKPVAWIASKDESIVPLPSKQPATSLLSKQPATYSCRDHEAEPPRELDLEHSLSGKKEVATRAGVSIKGLPEVQAPVLQYLINLGT